MNAAQLAEVELVWRVAVAALCGLAVGLERQWSGHASGPAARFAGLRTFFLYGVLSGVAGVLVASGFVLPGSVLIAGAGALAVAAYVRSSRETGDPDATTETAGIVIIALGVLAGLGHLRLATGAAAIVVLMLSEKVRLHAWVQRLDDRELRAALQFAVLALVILPLLPSEPVTALGGVRPQRLWIVVLLFSGLNFLGYVARRIVGPTRGYGVTGILGGLVSSTAVTLHFSRESVRQPALAGSLGLGVVGACTTLLPRVLVVSTLLNTQVAQRLLAYLAAPLLVGGVIIYLAVRRQGPAAGTASASESRSPLGLRSAIQMAVFFQLAVLAIEFVQVYWGRGGVLTSAAVLGVTNMDALTLAMTRLGTTPASAQLAAQSIAIGALASTGMKLALTLTLGTRPFQRVASLGLLALAAASAVGLWVGDRFA